MLRESTNHLKTKLLIGELADKEISNLNKKYKVCTAYEFQFDAIWIAEDTKKPRLYTGDVAVMFFDKDCKLEQDYTIPWIELQRNAKFILDYEVDGYLGHDSLVKRSNNERRDYELRRRNIFVKRIPLQTAKQRVAWISETQNDIINFYFKSISEYNQNAN